MQRLGVDFFLIESRLIDVIRICKQNELCCYQLSIEKQGVKAGFHIKDRNRIKHLFPQAHFLYTSGILGMLLRNFTRKEHVISYICVICLWFMFSMTLFEVDIYGESDKLDLSIETSVHKYMYQFKEVDEMKKELLTTYKNDISWLEVYEKGSSINIRYALKKNINNVVSNNQPLIAKKDGMIAYFKCDEGFKLRKVKDVVKVGDVLVDNKMLDSFGQNVEVKVSGKVYAYTWQQVNVEMDTNKLPEAMNYYSMLLEARNKIDIDIKNDEKVVKENILHFSTNKGKINLVILYTLLEDITS